MEAIVGDGVATSDVGVAEGLAGGGSGASEALGMKTEEEGMRDGSRAPEIPNVSCQQQQQQPYHSSLYQHHQLQQYEYGDQPHDARNSGFSGAGLPQNEMIPVKADEGSHHQNGLQQQQQQVMQHSSNQSAWYGSMAHHQHHQQQHHHHNQQQQPDLFLEQHHHQQQHYYHPQHNVHHHHHQQQHQQQQHHHDPYLMQNHYHQRNHQQQNHHHHHQGYAHYNHDFANQGQQQQQQQHHDIMQQGWNMPCPPLPSSSGGEAAPNSQRSSVPDSAAGANVVGRQQMGEQQILAASRPQIKAGSRLSKFSGNKSRRRFSESTGVTSEDMTSGSSSGEDDDEVEEDKVRSVRPRGKKGRKMATMAKGSTRVPSSTVAGGKKGGKGRKAVIQTGDKPGLSGESAELGTSPSNDGIVENNSGTNSNEDTAKSVQEVTARFRKGCECVDQNCFDGLDPASVFRHRLNVEEMTKLEHDMYLMGVTMACLESPDETHRHKERKRLRAKYRFMGNDVCLTAFLYLEHITNFQLKSIRKHVKDHGVTPRVHGNLRKKAHNAFPLDIYQHVTRFIQDSISKYSINNPSAKKKGVIVLPAAITCKKLLAEYKKFCQVHEPGLKIMSYTTFRTLLRDQFPNLRFHKDEVASTSQQQQQQLKSSIPEGSTAVSSNSAPSVAANMKLVVDSGEAPQTVSM